VVTRYFGGIKLGAGGLIRAYSTSAKEAIDSAGVVLRKQVQKLDVTVDYPLLGKLENEVRQTTYIIESIDYLEKVTVHLAVETDEVDTCKNWIVNLTSDQAEITETTQAYIEVPV
ncbi:MAG: IMPACT family protein, partial [Bacillota bacterium]